MSCAVYCVLCFLLSVLCCRLCVVCFWKTPPKNPVLSRHVLVTAHEVTTTSFFRPLSQKLVHTSARTRQHICHQSEGVRHLHKVQVLFIIPSNSCAQVRRTLTLKHSRPLFRVRKIDDDTCALHKGHKGNTETLTGELTEYAQQIREKDSTMHSARSPLELLAE